MVRLPMMPELVRQLFRKPATNAFPARYLPPSVTEFLSQVAKGEAAINPPVPVPPKFRGKIAYDRESCIGCQLCLKVCPCACHRISPDNKACTHLYCPVRLLLPVQ